MNDPLISVCIPVYNGDKYLAICLKSVLAQTYRNLEILLVDDGSSDQSIDIIKDHGARDPRIRLVRNDKNLGLVKNWIRCIELAKGEWIKFLFQDDLMNPDCVEKMYKSCIEHNVQFCLCARDFIIENTASDRLKNYFENKVYKLETSFPVAQIMKDDEIVRIAKDKLLQNFIGEPIVTFFSKGIVSQIGMFKLGLPQLVDYEFALRYILNTPAYFIPEKLVTFRVHGDAESDSHYSDVEKRIKNDLIEPVVLYHELLFDRHFSKLKQEIGAATLRKKLFSFYRKTALNYQPSLIKKNFRNLYKEYGYLRIIVFKAETSLLVKRIRIKYFA